MSSPAPTEDQLARRARTGDRAALGELIRRHWTRLVGYLRHLDVSRDDLDEVMNDVWVKVLGAAGRWRDGNFAWVMRIALNVVRDRRKKRRLPISDADAGGVVDLRPSNAPPDPDPRLADCLGQLNERYRKAVVAYYWGEMSYQEIADEQGVPVGTVGSGLKKALDQLRSCLGGEAP